MTTQAHLIELDMTYEEFHTKLHRTDLTVHAFAGLIGMRANSVSKYSKKGEVPAHLVIIATLMVELSNRSIDIGSALKRLDIVRKRPCGAVRNGDFLRRH